MPRRRGGVRAAERRGNGRPDQARRALHARVHLEREVAGPGARALPPAAHTHTRSEPAGTGHCAASQACPGFAAEGTSFRGPGAIALSEGVRLAGGSWTTRSRWRGRSRGRRTWRSQRRQAR